MGRREHKVRESRETRIGGIMTQNYSVTGLHQCSALSLMLERILILFNLASKPAVINSW